MFTCFVNIFGIFGLIFSFSFKTCSDEILLGNLATVMSKHTSMIDDFFWTSMISVAGTTNNPRVFFSLLQVVANVSRYSKSKKNSDSKTKKKPKQSDFVCLSKFNTPKNSERHAQHQATKTPKQAHVAANPKSQATSSLRKQLFGVVTVATTHHPYKSPISPLYLVVYHLHNLKVATHCCVASMVSSLHCCP